MKPLKKRIRTYMLQVTGSLMIVVLFTIMCLQLFVERHREYEKSVDVLTQIQRYITENDVSGDRTEETGESLYSEVLSMIRVNSDADYYVISEENGSVICTTVSEVSGTFCEEIGFRFEKIKTDSDGFFDTVNGKIVYCVFQKAGDAYVGRCVECWKMYQRIPTTILVFFLCLAMISCVLTYVVSRYMNRYVVDGIREINERLKRITEGDTDTKINIRTSKELSELSNYINTMVDSLSDTTSKISYVLSKTNMFIGVYEYHTGAKPVRCTEYIPRIFSLELDEWRRLTSDYVLFNEFIEKVRSKPFAEEQSVYVVSEEPEQYVKLEELGIGYEVFGVAIDVTEEIVNRRQLENERDVDLLTGLYNRRGFETQMSSLFREPETLGYAALVMIDADGLKGINDTYGHEKGDKYLKKVGSIINNFGIQSSLSARIGGDEFVLFLYDYDEESELLNTIRTIEYIQEHSTARLGEKLTVSLRFSFGYCMMTEGKSYEEMLKTADARMYENKRRRKEALVAKNN